MKSNYKYILLTAAISLGVGALAILPVVNSDNGYVAGFVLFPILILICLATVILFFTGVGFIAISESVGAYILIASLMLPVGFFSAAMMSKHFELGAYKEQPMRPIIPRVANKVTFKKGATHDEVQAFWREVLGEPHSVAGHMSRPGIQGISSNPDEDGHEVVTFAFFENATEEQKADIRRRINEYEPVLEFLENVDTSTKIPEVNPSPSKDQRKTISGEVDTYKIENMGQD